MVSRLRTRRAASSTATAPQLTSSLRRFVGVPQRLQRRILPNCPSGQRLGISITLERLEVERQTARQNLWLRLRVSLPRSQPKPAGRRGGGAVPGSRPAPGVAKDTNPSHQSGSHDQTRPGPGNPDGEKPGGE